MIYLLPLENDVDKLSAEAKAHGPMKLLACYIFHFYFNYLKKCACRDIAGIFAMCRITDGHRYCRFWELACTRLARSWKLVWCSCGVPGFDYKPTMGPGLVDSKQAWDRLAESI